MPEHSAALPAIEVVSWLWLAPALPLVGAAVVFATVRRRGELARAAAVLSGLGSLLSIVGHAWALRGSLGGPWLVDHVSTFLRAGALDATLGFVLEPSNALLAGAIALAGTTALFAATRRAEVTGPGLGGLLVALAASLVCALAADLVLLVAGLGGVTVASWLVTGVNDPESGGRGVAFGVLADAAALAGCALLLYGASGEWTGSDYTPAYRARIVGVQNEGAARPADTTDATGSLTIATLPGSVVRVDDTLLCEVDSSGARGGLASAGAPCLRDARTPLSRLPVAAGLRDVQLTPGGASDDLVAEQVRIDRGVETHVVSAQGSLGIVDLLSLPRLRDGSGEHTGKRQLTRPTPYGLSAAGLAALLFVLAAVAKVLSGFFVAVAPSSAVVLLVGASGVGAGVTLLLRISFLLELAPSVSLALLLAGAVVAASAGLAAAGTHDPKRALSLVGLATLGGALAGSGAGVPTHALLGVLAAATGLGALCLVAPVGDQAHGGRAASAAALAGAFVVSGAPLPFALGFWAREGILGAALGAGALAGAVAWVLLASSGAACSYAVWRVQARFATGAPKGPAQGSLALAALALAVVGVVLGALAFSDRAWGGTALSPLAEFVAPSLARSTEGAATSAGSRAVQLALGFSAAVAGWWLGRRHARDGTEPLELLRRSAEAGFGAAAVLRAAGGVVTWAAERVARMDGVLTVASAVPSSAVEATAPSMGPEAARAAASPPTAPSPGPKRPKRKKRGSKL